MCDSAEGCRRTCASTAARQTCRSSVLLPPMLGPAVPRHIHQLRQVGEGRHFDGALCSGAAGSLSGTAASMRERQGGGPGDAPVRRMKGAAEAPPSVMSLDTKLPAEAVMKVQGCRSCRASNTVGAPCPSAASTNSGLHQRGESLP